MIVCVCTVSTGMPKTDHGDTVTCTSRESCSLGMAEMVIRATSEKKQHFGFQVVSAALALCGAGAIPERFHLPVSSGQWW